MKNKIIFFGFSIILLLILGCKQKDPSTELLIPRDVANVIESGDISGCEQLKDVDACKTNFSYNEGMKYLDTSYCDLLDDDTQVEDCKNRIIFTKVGVENDYTFCNQLQSPELKAECLSFENKKQ